MTTVEETLAPPRSDAVARGSVWSTMSRVSRGVAIGVIGASFGIATGVAHTAILFITRHVAHQLVWFSREFVWMAPLVYTALMLPLALALALCAVVTSHRAVVFVAVAAFATIAVFGLLLPYPEIARVAALTLALGVGVQAARSLTPRTVAGMRAWRTVLVCSVLYIVAAVAIPPVMRRMREGRALASAPAAAADAPNVLLIILDTMRAASMGLYGAAQNNTPHLQQWARDGVTFDWAFSAAPWTLPSHASFFTGRHPDELSTDWKVPLDNRDSTVAELLRRRGYATAGFAANMQYTSYDSGLDRGFVHYEDYLTNLAQTIWSSSYTQTAMFQQLRHPASLAAVVQALVHPNLSIDMKHHFSERHADQIAAAFLRWQEGVHDRPFFAFLNFMDAHQPYFAPPAFHRFTSGQRARDNYAAAIAFLDSEIDSILTTLQRRQVLDRTIVIIAGDHGELFGATHDLRGHAHNVYLNVLRVPLVVRYPARVPRDTRISQAVSLRDLPATIVDLAAVRSARIPGATLAHLWSSDSASTSPVYVSVSHAPNVEPNLPTAHGPLRALLDDSLHYITNRAGEEELYAYRDDSTEAHNLVTDPARAAQLARLRQEVRRLRTTARYY